MQFNLSKSATNLQSTPTSPGEGFQFVDIREVIIYTSSGLTTSTVYPFVLLSIHVGYQRHITKPKGYFPEIGKFGKWEQVHTIMKMV